MNKDWAEKYRPKSLSKIVGNENAIRLMRRWAESWAKGPPRLKAMVLRGEPGIGKTSAALALANDFGWDVVEMNASDHRNAESIRKVAGAGAVSQTFTLDGEFLSSIKGRRKLIILDEADSLFGREDYGGAKAIVETVRESSQPIILIVNDYYELTRKASALKTLAEKATFNRLDRRSVIAVLKSVLQSEEVVAPPEVLDRIAENAGGDLRAAINDLQMLVEGKSVLTQTDSEVLGKRNQEKELGAALRTMFGAKSAREARDATLDLDKTPDELEKWIEESIPSEFRDARDLTMAFDYLSRADVYLQRTRRLQHYGLWGYAKEMMTSGVALSRGKGPRPYVNEYRFPGHFIVMSRASGMKNIRNSVASKLAPHLHTSVRSVNRSTLPLLCVLARRDRELLVRLGSELEFDEGDVAFLLGEEPSSRAVNEVMSSITEKMTGEGSERSSARSKAGRGSRGLGKF
jgi:replication factor C large subunit